MDDKFWKHWTEPNGMLITNIPINWMYLNPVVEPRTEEPPYSFEPYEDAIGCFQLSCYPLKELSPNRNDQAGSLVRESKWIHRRMDSDEFDVHIYYGAMEDQALIGKYIYSRELRGDTQILEQLELVDRVLNRIKVIPVNDRSLAANLDKYDRFLASLVASYDLLDAAIHSESYIEIVVIATNQIDAFLRLSIVIAKQLRDQTDDIEVKYLFQGDNEKGILERKIFSEAVQLGIIDVQMSARLNDIYDFRNRVIHRYIISLIRTRDIIPAVGELLDAQEEIRLVLRGLEDRQIGRSFGIYGRGFKRLDGYDEVEIKRAESMANDKHVLDRFRRKIAMG
ncbi:MAG TPA: hypothetical protein DHV67_06115 [Gallionella sp.]|nr:hypothetical protein [Gallionella sp.]